MRSRAAALAAFCLFAALPVPSRAQSIWAAEPDSQDLRAAFPERARQEQMSGEAVAFCHPDADGRLTDCKLNGEYPASYGFGEALLRLAPKYRIRLDARVSPKSQVILPLFFTAPGAAPPAREAAFQQSAERFAWLTPAGPYWPERALRMAAGGRAAIDCRITDQGRLTACRPASDEPVFPGFLGPTLRMAEVGWMTAGPKPVGVAEPADGYWRFTVEYPARDLCDDPKLPANRASCRAAMRAQGYR